MTGFDYPAFRKKWRRAELDQIDRELRRVGDSFDLVATFLADSPDAEALKAEAVALGERAKALRERCARLDD